jgi:hypothetical protein
MRTTLSIDDDVLFAARELAQQQNKTVGEVISALARQALDPAAAKRTIRNGVPLLPSRSTATPVTAELVNALREQQP